MSAKHKKYILPEGLQVTHKQLLEAKNYLRSKIHETKGNLVLNEREVWVLRKLLERVDFDPFSTGRSKITRDDLEALGLSTKEVSSPEEDYDPFGHLAGNKGNGDGEGEGETGFAADVEDLVPVSAAVVAPDATPGAEEPLEGISFGDEEGMPLTDLMGQEDHRRGFQPSNAEQYGNSPGDISNALKRVLAGESSPLGAYNKRIMENAARHIPRQAPEPESANRGQVEEVNTSLQEGLSVLKSLRKGMKSQNNNVMRNIVETGSGHVSSMSILGTDVG